MSQFIANMMRSDRERYDCLVEVMRLFSKNNIDYNQVNQLKTVFASKDKGPLNQVPLNAFKDAAKSLFKSTRQADEISSKVAGAIETQTEANGISQKMADATKFNTLLEFMKCFPLLVKNTDKNRSQGMDYVMQGSSELQKKTHFAENNIDSQRKPPQTAQPQSELDYVKHLVSLVLTRMEDKHRSLTDVFRFIDSRGKGKVRKLDFMAAVERMRISLSREDVTKVWNYIDAQQLGYI